MKRCGVQQVTRYPPTPVTAGSLTARSDIHVDLSDGGLDVDTQTTEIKHITCRGRHHFCDAAPLFCVVVIIFFCNTLHITKHSNITFTLPPGFAAVGIYITSSRKTLAVH